MAFNVRWGIMGIIPIPSVLSTYQITNNCNSQLLAGSLNVCLQLQLQKWERLLAQADHQLLVLVFTKDLLIDPRKRGTDDVTHTITAVASSTSKEKAATFIDNLGLPAECVAYGSYQELVADPNVDIVYIATPHSHHFENVMLALHAGKHVLCEKAFTVNAAQAKILCETAQIQNLFLMEAVWTRYLPVSVEVRHRIQQGEIGEVLRVIADCSFGEDIENKWGVKHRMVNKELAGGALLDREYR